MSTRCVSCGADNPPGAFCVNCGTRLTAGPPPPGPPPPGPGAAVPPPPPPPPRKRVNVRAIISTLLPLVIAGATLFGVLSRDKAEAAVTYEPPLAAGREPFTSPVDVAAASVGTVIPTPTPTPSPPGGTASSAASPTTGATTGPSIRPGNFGGTGFTTVCDRELLVRQLQTNPAALAAWAGVHGLAPEAVPAYIRSLRPASLAQDTRVTNFRFKGGKADPFQSIQAAGTAVLLDDAGRPVARCRCGNPLLEPQPVGSGTCAGCPKNYKPPALLPRGQVPPAVVAVNPPVVTGGTSTGPTPTPTPSSTLSGGGFTGDPSGRWTITTNEKISGPSSCTAQTGEAFNVSVQGSTVIFKEDGGREILRGPLTADGRFEGTVSGSESGQSYTVTWSGRFSGNQIVDGRSRLVTGGIECVYRWAAERRPFG